MKKFLMALGLSVLLITSIYGRHITLNINGQRIQTPLSPIQEAGTTLVPLRIISENLGAYVEWNDTTQTVTITDDTTTIKLTINNKTIYINNKKQEVSLAAKLIKGTTMVPIRVIGESLNSQVHWDEKLQTVFVVNQTGCFQVTTTFPEELGKGTYEGEVIIQDHKQVADGQGKLTFPGGDVYEGEFKADKFHGKGKYTFTNGESYEGEFENDLYHGFGKMIFKNGDVYEGEYKNDLRHGEGKYVFAKGGSYQGGYKNGESHGQVMVTTPEGKVYQTVFENGQLVK